ncbi:MAG: type II toxin-antitoxin system YafQ family toxin [Clostridium sp.]|nr:type II toxin-antitoxin system YafQ family toxin [Clostridium sp.]
MMRTIRYENSFKKDLKKIKKRSYDLEKIKAVINMLANDIELPVEYRDHDLAGKYKSRGICKCHIEPDWLLMYIKDNEELTLILVKTGTHSDLF